MTSTIDPATSVTFAHDLMKEALKAARVAHVAFVENGWTWADTHPEVPTVDQILETYICLADSVAKKYLSEACTGRLRAIAVFHEEEKMLAGIDFALDTGNCYF
jgi:hypothetical protein